MNKQKKKFIFKVSSFLILTWVALLTVREHKGDTIKKNVKIEKLIEVEIKKEKINKTTFYKNKLTSRLPASIKKGSQDTATPLIPRKVIGSSKFKLTNTISKNWKEKAYQNLSKVWSSSQKTFQKKTPIEIKSLKSAIFVKNGIGKNIEHVLVNLINDKGLPASFEAYIDSENGKIVQSWNKTRYEYREGFSISPTGREFIGLSVKKQ
jgi:hypothetical protein